VKEIEDPHIPEVRAIRLATGQPPSLVDRQVLTHIVGVLARGRTIVRCKESDAGGATQ
jgi:hypothetical protein